MYFEENSICYSNMVHHGKDILCITLSIQGAAAINAIFL